MRQSDKWRWTRLGITGTGCRTKGGGTTRRHRRVLERHWCQMTLFHSKFRTSRAHVFDDKLLNDCPRGGKDTVVVGSTRVRARRNAYL